MKSQGEQPGRRELVLHALRDAREPMRIADLTQQLGLHANTVRFHLAALVARGQVEQVVAQPQSPGRPPQLFRIPSRMDPTGPRQYRLLAEVLVDALAASPAPEEQAADAGRAWGRRQAQGTPANSDAGSLSRLITLLDEVGFAPELRAQQSQIALRHCPFLELTERRTDVICAIHLGFMQGAMDEWDAPATVDQLTPFAEPDRCLAHLTPLGETT